jgi:NADPH:quinone reductase-like Zn-dependent oxidoreductase
MKAIVYSDFGSADVLRCEEVEKPTAGDDQVLIHVGAAAVNPLDWRMMRGGPFIFRMLLRQPKVKRAGRDVAGRVEAVGKNITRFKPGDEVFGVCRGAFAEYACASESKLAMKPGSVSFEQAASVPIAALTALQSLRNYGRLQPGQRVLINGAAGGVGTFAVQIAKSLGAHVTGVCSTRNLEMVRSIGANQVIDYTREDFTAGKERYDVILDCISNHPLSTYRRVMNPKGRCVMAGGPKEMRVFFKRTLEALALSPLGRQKFVPMMARIRIDDLNMLSELMETGKVRPVIDRRYPLSEAPQAIRYLEEGHARGKVVIAMEA